MQPRVSHSRRMELADLLGETGCILGNPECNVVDPLTFNPKYQVVDPIIFNPKCNVVDPLTFNL